MARVCARLAVCSKAMAASGERGWWRVCVVWSRGVGMEGGGDRRAVEIEGEGGEGRAVAGEGRGDCCFLVASWASATSVRPHAIATGQSSMPLVESEEAVSLPLMWQGRLSPALRTSSAASQYGEGDVGSRGRMAREGSSAMMLPKRNNATPSTACNAVGDSPRWRGWLLCFVEFQINRM